MENRIRYPEIDDYIRATINRETGFLKEIEDYAAINHIPIISPETAAFMKVLVKLHKPSRILEVGTAIGYSALIMISVLGETSSIETIEINEVCADLAQKNISKMGFEKKIRIIRGDALEVLQCLSAPYDMIFVDASKGQYLEFLPECLRLIKSGGVIISDNVLYKGLVSQNDPVIHKHRTIAVKLREYLDLLCRDERLETAIVPIGDGLAVSIKR